MRKFLSASMVIVAVVSAAAAWAQTPAAKPVSAKLKTAAVRPGFKDVKAAVQPMDPPAAAKLAPLPLLPVLTVTVTKPKPGDTTERGPNLSHSATESYDIASASSGDHVYVAWTERSVGANTSIMFGESLDAGRTFKAAVHVTDGGSLPILALAGDTLHVFWLQGDKMIHHAARPAASGTFGSPDVVNRNSNAIFRPSVATSGNDVWIAWVAAETAGQHLRIKKLGSEGSIPVATDRMIASVRLAVEGGKVAIAYSHPFPNGGDLDVALAVGDGRVFTIDGAAGDYEEQQMGALVLAGDRTFWAFESKAYGYGRGGTILRTWSRDFSQYHVLSFIADAPPSGHPALARLLDPHLAAGVGGGIHLGTFVLHVQPASDKYGMSVHYSNLDSRFNSNTYADANGLDLAVDSKNEALLAWSARADAQSLPDVFAMNPTTREIYNLSESKGVSIDPHVVGTTDGFVVFWVDDTSGNKDIYFKAVPARH